MNRVHLLARLMGRLYRNPEPGDDGGGSDDPGDFGDMPTEDAPPAGDADPNVPAGDADPDAPPAGDADPDAPPAGDADPTKAKTDEDDPEEEWKDGEIVVKAKRSELRAAFAQRQVIEARSTEVAQREQQANTVLQSLTQVQQQAAQQIQAGLQHMQRMLVGEAPDPQLITTNPQEYMRQDAMHRQRLQGFQELMQQQQGLQQRAQQLSAAQMQQRVASEERALLQAVPEWRDPVARKAEGTKISAYLAHRGLTPEEIGGLQDHRSLLVARDAQRWHEYQATKGKRVAPAVPAPRVVRPGPAPTPASRGNPQNVRALDERLSRRPNDEDALTDRFQNIW